MHIRLFEGKYNSICLFVYNLIGSAIFLASEISVEDSSRAKNLFSSMALKPIKISWIRTGPQLHWKIMYGIVLQTILYEY